MNRKLKEQLKDLFFLAHKSLLRCKISVLPNHYYSPVPDINTLSANRGMWAHESSLSGLRWELEEQSRKLAEICEPFVPEYLGNRVYLEGIATDWGPGFGYIEAQALHAFIRYFKPRKIIEVGAGVTTHCMLAALQMNAKKDSRPGTICSIEPYPSTALQRAPVKLITAPVQAVDVSVFLELGKDDLLFIDSSHTVKTGSDVNFLILEVLPRLNPGVLVHFHDIYLPYDYSPEILCSLFDWQETSLLHALLVGNHRIEVLFCLSYLHHKNQELLRQVFPEYRPLQLPDGLALDRAKSKLDSAEQLGHFPASIFLRVRES
jgi:hypothetical protein